MTTPIGSNRGWILLLCFSLGAAEAVVLNSQPHVFSFQVIRCDAIRRCAFLTACSTCAVILGTGSRHPEDLPDHLEVQQSQQRFARRVSLPCDISWHLLTLGFPGHPISSCPVWRRFWAETPDHLATTNTINSHTTQNTHTPTPTHLHRHTHTHKTYTDTPAHATHTHRRNTQTHTHTYHTQDIHTDTQDTPTHIHTAAPCGRRSSALSSSGWRRT